VAFGIPPPTKGYPADLVFYLLTGGAVDFGVYYHIIWRLLRMRAWHSNPLRGRRIYYKDRPASIYISRSNTLISEFSQHEQKTVPCVDEFFPSLLKAALAPVSNGLRDNKQILGNIEVLLCSSPHLRICCYSVSSAVEAHLGNAVNIFHLTN
jgi:hypothetical protein